jgi:hypothetical protein
MVNKFRETGSLLDKREGTESKCRVLIAGNLDVIRDRLQHLSPNTLRRRAQERGILSFMFQIFYVSETQLFICEFEHPWTHEDPYLALAVIWMDSVCVFRSMSLSNALSSEHEGKMLIRGSRPFR